MIISAQYRNTEKLKYEILKIFEITRQNSKHDKTNAFPTYLDGTFVHLVLADLIVFKGNGRFEFKPGFSFTP